MALARKAIPAETLLAAGFGPPPAKASGKAKPGRDPPE
jgi:hypothetical protein